jgi:parvulin-like peptidyl-prolyl isomerase
MSPLRITLAVLGTSVALVAAGCGSSQAVPENSIAVVEGTPITKAQLDALITQTKNNYKATKRPFPKAGTPEYQNLQTLWVSFLVQNAELHKEAAKRGVAVTSKNVDAAEKQLVDSQFGGKRSAYVKALKAQGLTPADYRPILERQALMNRLFDVVTKDVTVSDQEILDYYTQNQANYPAPVDYAKSKTKADKIYAQLKAGASFAALAKQYSQDPGSKDKGGKLTIKRGQTVPQFDETAFKLGVGEISKPVRTQYGYHVIQALSPIKGDSRVVRHILIAEHTGTGLAKYRASIRQTLLQQKRNDAMNSWVEKLTNDNKSKVDYAAGYEPPTLPEVPTTATE